MDEQIKSPIHLTPQLILIFTHNVVFLLKIAQDIEYSSFSLLRSHVKMWRKKKISQKIAKNNPQLLFQFPFQQREMKIKWRMMFNLKQFCFFLSSPSWNFISNMIHKQASKTRQEQGFVCQREVFFDIFLFVIWKKFSVFFLLWIQFIWDITHIK